MGASVPLVLRRHVLKTSYGIVPDCTSEDARAYTTIPILFPTRFKTSSACCNSSCVCVAVTIVRIRAFPSGTVGNAIPVPITPSLNSSRENSMVSLPSPMMMGVIGVSLAGVLLPPMSKPRRASSFFQKRVFSHSFSMRSGSFSRTSKAAMQVAATRQWKRKKRKGERRRYEVAATCIAALEIVWKTDLRREWRSLWENARFLEKEARPCFGFGIGGETVCRQPKTDLIPSSSATATHHGFFPRAVQGRRDGYGHCIPEVAEGKARIRTIVTQFHAEEELGQALEVLRQVGKRMGILN